MEVIVLAGGFGTRLQHVVADVPKCLAPVNGQPFLAHLFAYLERQYCDHVVLSLGYKHELVLEWLKTKAFTFKVTWVIEKEPLGTGGGIRLASRKCKEEDCFVINGDTLYEVDLKKLWNEREIETKAIIALKPMLNFDRYGTVVTNEDGYITQFEEKKHKDSGNINGGIYLLQSINTLFADFPDAFSLEKDFFEVEAGKGTLKGVICDDYFIDIGVEEDYNKAQKEIGI